MFSIENTNDKLQRNQEIKPLKGFSNLLDAELKSWWTTKKWWISILIWTGVINGMLLLLLTSLPLTELDIHTSIQIYVLFSWMGTSIGIIIMLQDSIITEKQTGTAEWVLSKPVSRMSFILAKFTSNAIGSLLTMILAPGIFGYTILWLWDFDVTIISFIGGIGLLYLNILFFLTFTLMTGAFFNTRAPAIGIPLAFLFGQQYLSSISTEIYKFIPFAIGNAVKGPPLAVSVMLRESLWSIQPIVFTAIFAILFLIIAIKRFEYEEF